MNTKCYRGKNMYVKRTVLAKLVVEVAFSSLARTLGECSTIHSPPELFYYFKLDINSRTLIPPFSPGSVHKSSASSDDCDRVLPDELRVSSFPDRFPHYAWTAT